MLSREVMGVLALAILWINTGLIAAAALKQRWVLQRLSAELTSVRRGRVVRGDGPGGAIAALQVKQVGRLVAARVPSIVFHDQDHASILYGGRLAVESGDALDLASSERVEVWIEDSSYRDAAACASLAAFDAACADAKKARGFARRVEAPILSGQDLFIATLGRGHAEERLLVSTFDPASWLSKKMALVSFFVVAEILVAGACTAASLHPPLFGLVSTIGGAASLAFFLLVQPIGTQVRDAIRLPSRALRKGSWTQPGAAPVAKATAG
jgi:hypothetical protein